MGQNKRDHTWHMMLVICHVMPVCVMGKIVPSSGHAPTTCQISLDPVYGRHLVNCSSLGLKELTSDQLPDNVTTLILQDNEIASLTNNFFSFPQLTSLRHLSVRASLVSSIEVDALSGLWNLETLDLEHNDLRLCKDNRSFPADMFKHVPNLRHLFIGFNTNSDINTKDDSGFNTKVDSESPKCQVYSDYIDIFSCLPQLTNLSIDSLSNTLHLGPEFEQLPLLENITVVCSFVKYITNNSLHGLRQLPLRVLSLINFQLEIELFELGLFENLPHLDHLTVDDSHVGNHKILLALYPLSNRNMTSLYLRKTNVFATYSIPSVALDDGIISESLSRSLRSICLKHFSWIDTFLFAFKPNSVTSGAWPDCITSLDFSRNKLDNVGWVPTLFEVIRLKRLSHVTLSSVLTPLEESYPRLIDFDLPASYGDHDTRLQKDTYSRANLAAANNKVPILSKPSSQNDTHTYTTDKRTLKVNIKEVDNNTHNQNKHFQKTLHFLEEPAHRLHKAHSPNNASMNDQTSVLTNEKVDNRTHSQSRHFQGKELATAMQKSQFPFNGNITYYFPRSLRTLKIINMIFSPMTIGSLHIVCARNENFEELYWINNQLIEAKGVISSVDTLKLLDISGSIFDIADHLFDTFYGLQVFVLREVQPDTFFRSISIQRLLRNLTNLRYLDVSNNRLNSLLFPPDTFASTPNISHIILSQNRFSSIPFYLETTPNLRRLDLSENAILFLTEEEREELDRHVSRVGELVINLEDNAIACVCSQLDFMVWMFETPVTIQQSSTFQCLTEDGLMIQVASREDLLTFSRVCQGRLFLMASLILASLMIIAFLSVYLVARFGTAIQAILMNIARLVRPLGPSDYKIGVFIGYADDDYTFVRHGLMPYLEQRCQMVTYIHQRDLRPGYKIKQFDQVITNSWRVLLVLSRSFLQDYDMSQIVMMLASHSVTAMNRKRVIALVEKGQVHAIPSDLYAVLDESNIIFFDDFRHHLNYEQRQGIKHCLRPS